MIPKVLTIKGMYSYRQTTKIDFEQLSSAGIFGIFGTVGSGKSTILEAITYALYGKTERLSMKGQGYNMMNLRSQEMVVEFEFEHEQRQYRFNVRAKRKGTNFEDVYSPERKAYRLKGLSWEPLEETNAEAILGLKYEHFKQIVIIPQGKFQEFVHLTPGDRNKMLKELFPLDRYDFKEILKSMNDKNTSERRALEGRLAELTDYTQERIDQLNEKLELLKEYEQQKQKEKRHASDALQKMEILQTKKQELGEVTSQWNQLEEQREEYLNREQKLTQFKRFEREVKPFLSQLDDRLEEWRNGKDEKEKKEQSAQRLSIQKDLLVKQETRLIETYTSLSDLVTRREHAQKGVARHALVEQEQRLQEVLNEKLRVLTGVKEKIQKWEHELIEKEAALDHCIKKRLNETELVENQHCLKQLSKARSEVQRITKEQNELHTLITDLGRSKAEYLTLLEEVDIEVQSWIESPANKALDRVNEIYSGIEQSIEQVDLRYKTLLKTSGLSAHVHTLTSGEACPLCGSLNHPKPYSSTEKKVQITHIEQSLALLKHRRKVVQDVQGKVRLLIERFGERQKDRRTLEVQLDTYLNEVETHKHELDQRFKYSSEDSLNEAFEVLEQQNKEIKKLEFSVKEIKSKLVDKSRLATLESEYEECNNASIVLKTKIEDRTQSLEDYFVNTSKIDLEQFLSDSEKELLQWEKLEEEKSSLEKRLQTETIELRALVSNLERCNTRVQESKVKLQQVIEQNEFPAEEHIREVLNSNLSIEKEERILKEYDTKRSTLSNRKKNLETFLEEHPFDEEKYHQTLQLKLNVTRQLEQLYTTLGEVKEQLHVGSTKYNLRLTLEKEYKALSRRYELLKQMNELMRKDGFVKYISTIYLQQLCALANERFKLLTHNQLQLEMDDEHNFIVRDFLHDGRTRLLKTLSGGQTFQASLCLALALSEQLQMVQQVKQQFFFMDEGFGSLDRQSLSLVFESLKQLRKEDRIVGIISHVDELQEEIDLHLTVTNSDEKGSTVRLSGRLV